MASVPLFDSALDAQRQEPHAQLARPGDLRPRSSSNSRDAGTPTANASGHGPRWLLITNVAGTSRSRVIQSRALGVSRAGASSATAFGDWSPNRSPSVCAPAGQKSSPRPGAASRGTDPPDCTDDRLSGLTE